MTSALLTQTPALIQHLNGGGSVLCFGETNSANFISGTPERRGTMLARVYSPDEFDDGWRLIWFEMVSEWYVPVDTDRQPHWQWNYVQRHKRYLTADEVVWCEGLIATR